MSTITNEALDQWVDDKLEDGSPGPVALHLKQKLLSVEGEGGVIFPPTYADIGYNIDTLSDGTKVATMDSVGSQANHMEPMFKLPDYAALVPQIEIEYGDNRKVSIFEVGHRLGDALIRSTNLKAEAQQAFKTLLETGNALAIAKLAPTSLVFGVWDSRDTQAKLPRLVQSVIRAWKVEPLTRSATYSPPLNYTALDVFSEEDKAKAEGDSKNPLSKRGFVNALNTSAPGGVVSDRIEQDITVNLVALRRIQAGDEGETKKLRRYLLGLSLVAATMPPDGFLRQGCLLTLDPDSPASWKLVNRNGKREDCALTHEAAKSYAAIKANDFGVAKSKTVIFNKDLAKADAATDKKAASKSKGGKGKKADAESVEGTAAEE